jgi:uncharacterized RDD family membrane protein YckC
VDPITEHSDFAPRWRRLAAYLLDGVFLTITAWLFLPSDQQWIGWVLRGSYIVISNIVGVSPGKYYLRILIQSREGERPGAARGLVRSADTIVAMLLSFAGADTAGIVVFLVMQLGYFTILTHSERRSVYDQLAGTWVVRGRRGSTPPVTI